MTATASKDNKFEYCASALLNIAAKENIQVLALTSSFSDEKQSEVIDKIMNKIKQLGKSVLLLDMKSTSEKEILKKLDEDDLCKTNDLIFVRLLPVKTHFSAIHAAEKCQGAVLLEKYTRTKHKEFDELMETLAQNEIHVCGAITY